MIKPLKSYWVRMFSGVFMGVKDKTEEILKEAHVFLANAKEVSGDKKKVIVDRDKFLELLRRLSDCMFEMMEEYDITEAKKDKIDRELRQKSEKIKDDAKKDAEDIYAASIMYTDEALRGIISVIDDTKKRMETFISKTGDMLEEQRSVVNENQMELISKLETLRDTNKYIKLIEDENQRLKNKDKQKNNKNSRFTSVNADKNLGKIEGNYSESYDEYRDSDYIYEYGDSGLEEENDYLSQNKNDEPKIIVNEKYIEKLKNYKEEKEKKEEKRKGEK